MTLQAALRLVSSQLVTKKVGKQKVLFIVVTFLDTGAIKHQIKSPFQKPLFRGFAISLVDLNHDGVADFVKLTAKTGTKTKSRLLAI